MTSANNGSGSTWSAIIDCYAVAFGIIAAPTDCSDNDTSRRGVNADR